MTPEQQAAAVTDDDLEQTAAKLAANVDQLVADYVRVQKALVEIAALAAHRAMHDSVARQIWEIAEGAIERGKGRS